MPNPIFSNLVRTSDNLTAGITNIPLTYPAKIFFNCDSEDNYYNCLSLMHDYDLPITTMYNKITNRYFIQTIDKVDSKTIKQIWRNWKNVRPKFNSDYRYLMWEIDEQSNLLLNEVLTVFRYLRLPVYVHKTMRGYHFISIKPVTKGIFNWAIDKLRHTNADYPPITLRIKPNKYVGEDKIWNEGFIISEKYHSDTHTLYNWLVNQDFDKIGQQYQLVWYLFDKKKETAI